LPAVDHLLVRFFVAITDSDWLSCLSSFGPLDDVNFWQPSGSVDFKAPLPGEQFLLKLHSLNDCIVGGGFLSHYSHQFGQYLAGR
jgi:putative restriction endonuclease